MCFCVICFSCYPVSKARWNKSILRFINSGLHNIYWKGKAPVALPRGKRINSIKFWKINSLLVVFFGLLLTEIPRWVYPGTYCLSKIKKKKYSFLNFKILYIEGIINNTGHKSIIKTSLYCALKWVYMFYKPWVETNVSAVKSIEHEMKECILVSRNC